MLAGMLTNKEKHPKVAFFAQINPLEKNYEETLLTLSYMDKIKNSLVMESKHKTEGPFIEHIGALDKLLQRVSKENENLTHQFQDYVNEENEDFEELRKKLGLEYSVQSILSA